MKKTLTLLVAAVLALAAAAAAPLRFLSFNIYGYGAKEGIPPESRSDGVEESIAKCKADVISLQEVAPAWWDGTPLFAHLAAEFGTDIKVTVKPGIQRQPVLAVGQRQGRQDQQDQGSARGPGRRPGSGDRSR